MPLRAPTHPLTHSPTHPLTFAWYPHPSSLCPVGLCPFPGTSPPRPAHLSLTAGTTLRISASTSVTWSTDQLPTAQTRAPSSSAYKKGCKQRPPTSRRLCPCQRSTVNAVYPPVGVIWPLQKGGQCFFTTERCGPPGKRAPAQSGWKCLYPTMYTRETPSGFALITPSPFLYPPPARSRPCSSARIGCCRPHVPHAVDACSRLFVPLEATLAWSSVFVPMEWKLHRSIVWRWHHQLKAWPCW